MRRKWRKHRKSSKNHMQAENTAEIASTDQTVELQKVVVVDKPATGRADEKKRSQISLAIVTVSAKTGHVRTC